VTDDVIVRGRECARNTVWSRWSVHLVLVAVVVVAATLFFVADGETVRRVVGGVGSTNGTALAVGLLCSIAAMVNRGMLNRAAHHAIGLEATVPAMTRTASVAFAAQKVCKVAAAGLLVFLRHGRRRGHEPAAVAAACTLTSIAASTAMGVLLAVALAAMATTGTLSGWWIAAALGFAIYGCAVVVGALLLRGWIRRDGAAQALERFGRRVPFVQRMGPSPDAFATEFVDHLSASRERGAAIGRLLLHAVASKALGAMMLMAAVAATGAPLSTPRAVTIYAGALAASMVSIVPSGLGVVEGSVAATLIAFDVAPASAALAVALFRFLDLWVPVLTGLALGRRELRLRTPAPEPLPVPLSVPSPVPLSVPLPVPLAVPPLPPRTRWRIPGRRTPAAGLNVV
jgi:putative heme transporter